MHKNYVGKTQKYYGVKIRHKQYIYSTIPFTSNSRNGKAYHGRKKISGLLV